MTETKTYAKQGLRELLEYIALLKDENKDGNGKAYYADFDDVYGDAAIHGAVFSQADQPVIDGDTIHQVSTGGEDNLKDFLEFMR